MKLWYTNTVSDIENQLNTSCEQGLDIQLAEKRLAENGLNQLPEAKVDPIWLIFLRNFTEPLVIILLAAAIISLVAGEFKEAVVIAVIVMINALIATYQEMKTRASLDALKQMTIPTVNVIRSGQKLEIESSQLVVGDVVLLEVGQYIPADLRIVEAANLMIDESALTGESIPVDKTADVILQTHVALAEQTNMAFTSTLITNGRATGVVTGTGVHTEIGKIAAMLGATKEVKTPLQVQLAKLSKQIAYVAFGVGIVAIVLLLLRGSEVLESMISGITLAVAVIPESLPVIVSIVLALSVSKMAKKNAIVKQLPAVETLGSVSVICSDKTGTLTKNEMTVTNVFAGMEKLEVSNLKTYSGELLMYAMALCNDSTYTEDGTAIGDPTELALTHYVSTHYENVEKIRTACIRVDEIPFDSDRKLMTTVSEYSKEYRVFTKGAADQLIERCTHILVGDQVEIMDETYRNQIHSQVESYSHQALRVLGYATKIVENLDSETYESNLTFIGMSGMIDPEREEAKEAIKVAKKAGVRTVMITGDHKITAFAIGRNLGMVSDLEQVRSGEELDEMSDEALTAQIMNISVFARVSPEHKVRIVKALQAQGLVVSMTGDGVNDAPSLRTADVGVAMGITGTDVSKEAANMILTDDNFATIVQAVSEGRNIYAKIKKAITFILATNLAEVLAIMLAIVLIGKQPLAAVHVLWVNLIVESLLAIPMGSGKNNPLLMNEKPRPKTEPIITNMVGKVVMIAVITFLTVVGTYLYFLNTNPELAQTMTFIVMANAPIIYALSVSSGQDFTLSDLLGNKNPQLYGAALAGLLINAIVVLSPIHSFFKVESVTISQYIIMIVISCIPFIIFEILKLRRKVK
ncbi:MAG: cation-translocating P-type ATPase [Culicoidibacterales bacterium]